MEGNGRRVARKSWRRKNDIYWQRKESEEERQRKEIKEGEGPK